MGLASAVLSEDKAKTELVKFISSVGGHTRATREADKQTDKQKEKQSDRKTDRQVNKNQIDTYVNI